MGQDTRKQSVLTMTLNTGRSPYEKSILIAKGGSFQTLAISNHKANIMWDHRYNPYGTSLFTPAQIR